MERMSAFFHLRPVLLTKDVPASYGASNPLDAETWINRQQERATDDKAAKLWLPIGGGKKGLWEWLQSSQVPGAGGEKNRYDAFDVGEEGKLVVHTSLFSSFLATS